MKKVFIASRFGEEKISKVRDKLAEELINIRIEPIDLNDNMAVSQPPIERSLESVRKSDIVIVLLGDTYGTIPKGYEKSYTHLEYIEAIKYKEKVKTYVFGIGKLYKNNEIKYSSDTSVENWQKEILDNSTIGTYSDVDSIESIVHSIIMNMYREENKVWFDEDTGLMWKVQVDTYGESGGRFFWKDIFKYKDDLNKSNYDGYNDWRIPTIEELKTLLTETGYSNDYSYDSETFIKKPLLYSMTMDHARFWSSTSSSKDTKKAFGVHFGRRRKNSQSEKEGKDKAGKTRYIRCVRLNTYEEIEEEWNKVKESENIQEIESFITKYPESKYVNKAEKTIEILKEKYEDYIQGLPVFERFLVLYEQKKDTSGRESFLLENIKEITDESEKCEALKKLKEDMVNNKKWKDPANAKDPDKAKQQTKYKITQSIIELLSDCS